MAKHSMTEKRKICEILEKKGVKIYFSGICGASMSALAELLHKEGFLVTGSDVKERGSTGVDSLGIRRYVGQRGENVLEESPDLFVYTLALDEKNPEISAAVEMGVLCISRAELMGAMMGRYEKKIAVIGSHGKSTTTAMLGKIFEQAGKNPTVLSGADLGHGSCLRYGGREYLIYEGCEYRGSFLHFYPDVTILLNIDLDHTDYYSGIEELSSAFLKAANLSSLACVINSDDDEVRKIQSSIKPRAVRVGKGDEVDFSYKTEQKSGKISVTVGGGCGAFEIPLSVLGEHNAENAAMAASAALYLGISQSCVKKALSEFKATPRRLQYLGKCRGAAVYYDYAHHPKEIAATLSALSSVGYKRTAVLFCPHTYTRTKSLWGGFVKSLGAAAWAFITEIFPAREEPIPKITGERLAKAVSEAGGAGEFFSKNSPTIDPIFEVGADSIVLMGAGDFGEIYKKFIEAIDKESELC